MNGNPHRFFYIATAVPLLLVVIGIIMLLLSGIGYRLGWWDFRIGFGLLQWGASLGVVAAVMAAVAAAAMLAWYRQRSLIIIAGLTVIAGIVAAFVPWSWQQQAASVPAIHDISTDTENPPAYVAVESLRYDATNPLDYPGAETASIQREAYPDIEPIYFNAPPEAVFRASEEAVVELDWELVAADESDGRIEAVDTTRWFGFKDDIVIRIQADNGRTRLDVRSKSRVGRSDAGTNARRIRLFREVMQAKFAS